MTGESAMILNEMNNLGYAIHSDTQQFDSHSTPSPPLLNLSESATSPFFHSFLDFKWISKFPHQPSGFDVRYHELAFSPLTNLFSRHSSLRHTTHIKPLKIIHLTPKSFIVTALQSRIYEKYHALVLTASDVFRMRMMINLDLQRLRVDDWSTLFDEALKGCFLCEFYRKDLQALQTSSNLEIVELCSDEIPPSFLIT